MWSTKYDEDWSHNSTVIQQAEVKTNAMAIAAWETLKRLQDPSVPSTLEAELADNGSVSWDTVFVNRTLYVLIPNKFSQSGSQASIVWLLDYAETNLHCSHVIACIRKNQKDLASELRPFNFYSFVMLKPTHELVPVQTSDLVYMAYTVDVDGGSSDSD